MSNTVEVVSEFKMPSDLRQKLVKRMLELIGSDVKYFEHIEINDKKLYSTKKAEPLGPKVNGGHAHKQFKVHTILDFDQYTDQEIVLVFERVISRAYRQR